MCDQWLEVTLWLQVERKNGQLVLTEETHREGVLAGSTYLNTMLVQHVRSFIGSDLYDTWTKDKPVDAVKFEHDRVELQKRNFDGTGPIKLELPMSLLRMLPEQVSRTASMLCVGMVFHACWAALAYAAPVYMLQLPKLDPLYHSCSCCSSSSLELSEDKLSSYDTVLMLQHTTDWYQCLVGDRQAP